MSTNHQQDRTADWHLLKTDKYVMCNVGHYYEHCEPQADTGIEAFSFNEGTQTG